MATSSGEFSRCEELNFQSSPDSVSRRLAAFDAIVFVNSSRYVAAAAATGAPSFFVDTLAWLRESPPPCVNSVQRYFVQRFFDHTFAGDFAVTTNVDFVGAILPRVLNTNERRPATNGDRPLLVHCGGLFSPIMIAGADIWFFTELLYALKSLDRPVEVIVPGQLHDEITSAVLPRHVSLVQCSPLTVGSYLRRTSMAVTTSGIEFTYESLLHGVPTVFLPAFNATQQLQLRFHRELTAGAVTFDEPDSWPASADTLDERTAKIQADGMSGLWRRQFDEVMSCVRRLVADRGCDGLCAVRERQSAAMRRVGCDGAQTIANQLNQELVHGGRAECIYPLM